MYTVILEKYLRRFEPLKDAKVGYRTELQGQLAPFLVLVHGFISLHGQICEYEVEVDMRDMNDAGDLDRLAAMIIRSFDKAAGQVQSVH